MGEPELERILGVIGSLRALPGVAVRADRPDLEWQGVAPASLLTQVDETIRAHLGAPLKPGGERVPFRMRWNAVVRELGGVRREQALYLVEIPGTGAVYAAIWPWSSDAKRFTMKVGVHGAEGAAKAEAIRLLRQG